MIFLIYGSKKGIELICKIRPNFTPWSEGNIILEKGKLTGMPDDFSFVNEKYNNGIIYLHKRC